MGKPKVSLQTRQILRVWTLRVYIYTNIDSVEGWQVHFGCSLVVYIHVMFVRGPDQWQCSELRGCLEQVRRWGKIGLEVKMMSFNRTYFAMFHSARRPTGFAVVLMKVNYYNAMCVGQILYPAQMLTHHLIFLLQLPAKPITTAIKLRH